ncbi:hypothetical protein [Parasitella parasitica]|uniref:Fe2OG dioxygenase domain-containing protein n=1 Tax=Parasitella parasitica TaxID=35722 RepID=A0A0B7N791_9FUNG|nr:hypothetical protein [Parasitella parasitica]
MPKANKKVAKTEDDKSGGSASGSTKFPALTQNNFLHVNELEADQIYVIPKFLNGKECEQLIRYFETNLPPKASAGGKPRRGEAFRNNDRQSIQDPKLAKTLWEGLQRIVVQEAGISGSKVPKGLNSNIRVYRYRKGHSFGAHYDESVQDVVTGLWTDWTLLIYLNEDMKGGETVFYRNDSRKSDPIVVQPRKGMALLHRHGVHCLLHEAMEVTEGSKWVLRSDVLV